MNLPDKEIPATETKSTHAVDILALIEAQEFSSLYFETPYYLAPAPGGEKVYALLRETLRRTRKIGIAYVVIHARQHLAALIPDGQSLVLNTLRWASETGSEENTKLSVRDVDAGLLMERKPALPEEMKPTEIVVENILKGLLEDDQASDDVYLAAALRPRLHSADGYAMRRAGTTQRRRR